MTRDECIAEAAVVLVAAVIRIEQDRIASVQQQAA